MEPGSSNSYSDRELDSKFNNLLEHMKEFEGDAKDSLGRILTQTTKTNGRVSSLEDEAVTNKVFRAQIMTAIAILTFILGMIVIPLTASYVSNYESRQTQKLP